MKKLTVGAVRTIRALCKTQTRAAEKAWVKFMKVKPAKVVSAKAKKARRIIEKAGMCGKYKTAAAELVGLCLGEKVVMGSTVEADRGKFYARGVMIRCTANPNSHNYGMKAALLSCLIGASNRGVGGLRFSMETGNNLPSVKKDKSPVRYATNGEIDGFFDEVVTKLKAKRLSTDARLRLLKYK